MGQIQVDRRVHGEWVLEDMDGAVSETLAVAVKDMHYRMKRLEET